MSSSSRDQSSQPDLTQRILKLALILGAAYFIYAFLYPVVAGMYGSTIDSHLQQDFKVIAEALERREVRGEPFYDLDLTKLQGKDLEDVPRDPWGKPYIYDVIFSRIVSCGPNNELESYVPGVSDPSLPAQGGDDRFYPRQKLSQIVTGTKDEGASKSRLVGIPIDGSDPEAMGDLDGDVVAAHTVSGAKGVVVLVRQGGKTMLMGRLESGPFKPLTNGSFDESNPWWYSPASDVVLFDGVASPGGPRQIYKVDVGSPSPVPLTSGSSDAVEPAVDGNKTIYFAGKKGANTEIETFSFTQREPKTVAQKSGADLRSPSPDMRGEQLAYIVSDGSAWALEIKDLRSGKVTPVDKPVMKGTLIAWSPGADKIAYMSPTEDGTGSRFTMYHLQSKLKAYPRITPPIGRFGWIKQ